MWLVVNASYAGSVTDVVTMVEINHYEEKVPKDRDMKPHERLIGRGDEMR